jgi:hypothetical protein
MPLGERCFVDSILGWKPLAGADYGIGIRHFDQ